MDKLTKQQCVEYIRETYEEFKSHTLGHLTSYDLAAVDSLMSDMEDHTLVPNQLIQDIDDMTEAGFDAADQLDTLCSLLAATQGKDHE